MKKSFMKPMDKKDIKVRATPESAVSAMSYEELVDKIGAEWERGRSNAIRAVNIEYVQTRWRIGRYIVEFEQHGKARAKYGTGLIERLAHDLTARHGRGFSRSKLIYARLFYVAFPKSATLSHLLSWSHYIEHGFSDRISRIMSVGVQSRCVIGAAIVYKNALSFSSFPKSCQSC